MQRLSFFSLALLVLITAFGCNKAQNPTAEEQTSTQVTSSAPGSTVTLDVYKSPTCGCCADWITHTETNGFKSVIHHPENLDSVKQELGIAPQYQSCHTGVSSDGFIFEGHVPARLMKKFLAEKPKDAIGLAVPGMPIGSPGMEMDDRITPYDVLLLHKDGSSSVYERITALEK
ncbi:MAG: DUF411 domain-containing protein [Cellvibrionaceae bacterium]|nr:DUF411 domain-containing protein [Cellvibrionaceae bacterium]